MSADHALSALIVHSRATGRLYTRHLRDIETAAWACSDDDIAQADARYAAISRQTAAEPCRPPVPAQLPMSAFCNDFMHSLRDGIHVTGLQGRWQATFATTSEARRGLI